MQFKVWQLYSIKNSIHEFNEIHSLLQNENIDKDQMSVV